MLAINKIKTAHSHSEIEQFSFEIVAENESLANTQRIIIDGTSISFLQTTPTIICFFNKSLYFCNYG